MCSAEGDAALPAPGFPISGIHGSKAVQRLTVAYRSRPRPSSTLGAKASTMCPYYLDGDLTEPVGSAGDTRFATTAYRSWWLWLLCSFQGPPRRRWAGRVGTRADRRAPVSQNSTACSASSWAVCRAAREAPRPLADARRRLGRPGPVDVLAARSVTAVPPAAGPKAGGFTDGAVYHVPLR